MGSNNTAFASDGGRHRAGEELNNSSHIAVNKGSANKNQVG